MWRRPVVVILMRTERVSMAWNPNAKAAQGQTGCEVANSDNTIMVNDNGNELMI